MSKKREESSTFVLPIFSEKMIDFSILTQIEPITTQCTHKDTLSFLMGSISSSNSTGVLPNDWGSEDLTFIGNASVSIHIVTYPVFTIPFDLCPCRRWQVTADCGQFRKHEPINGRSDLFSGDESHGDPFRIPSYCIRSDGLTGTVSPFSQ